MKSSIFSTMAALILSAIGKAGGEMPAYTPGASAPGLGAQRARAREAEARKARVELTDDSPLSRQRMRQLKRLEAKMARPLNPYNRTTRTAQAGALQHQLAFGSLTDRQRLQHGAA